MDPDVVTFDLEFVDNARIEWFHWDADAASPAETDQRALAAARLLGELFRPDRWTVTLGSFTHGFPDDGPHERRELAEPAGEGIHAIEPGPGGALRIAVPELATLRGAWRLRDEDGADVAHEIRPAEPLHGLHTVWVHVARPSLAASDLSVFVGAVGEVQARLTLGATVFAPQLDTRPPGQLVRGAPVAAWHEVNAALLAHVTQAMHRAGWARGRRPD